MAEIYISGGWGIETSVSLTDEQVDELYHKLSGLDITVRLPEDIATMLEVNAVQSDWIDEVEILN